MKYAAEVVSYEYATVLRQFGKDLEPEVHLNAISGAARRQVWFIEEKEIRK